jgi:hypothetical protein
MQLLEAIWNLLFIKWGAIFSGIAVIIIIMILLSSASMVKRR